MAGALPGCRLTMAGKAWDRTKVGPRLTTPKHRECWHCAEDRRVLEEYRIVRAGVTFGTVQLCGQCVTGMPRDPDPLDGTAA